MKTTHNRAFTLIELLVVVAIIAILTGMILNNIMGARVKSRDARRVSDLGQIQLALEQYFDRCGQYPDAAHYATPTEVLSQPDGCPSGASSVSLSQYISVIPTPPSSGSYVYSVNGTSDYILQATLEQSNNDVLKNSLGMTLQHSSSGYSPYIDCNTTTLYCIGPK